MANEFVQLISNVGFPIAVSVAMFWMLNKQTETHKQEMATVTEALNANTAAIQRLTDHIDEKE